MPYDLQFFRIININNKPILYTYETNHEVNLDTLRINPTKNTANDMWKVYQKIWYTFLACYRKSSPPLK